MVKLEKTKKLFFISLLLHVGILSAFIISFEWSSHNFVMENDPKSEVINAVFVNNSKIQTPKPEVVAAAPKVEQPPKKVMPPPPPPKKTPPEVVKKIPTPTVVKNTIAIPDPKKKEKEIQKNLIQEQLLAELEEEKKQRKKKQKDLQKSFQKELKAQAAKSLQQQLLAETNKLANANARAQSQKMQGIVDKYKALIQQSISQHWLVPSGVNKSLSTELLIRVAAGGVVLDVQLVKSSGDPSLDRSARTAVFKASPLPVPANSEEFEPFRQFILKVKPENVITREAGLS